MFQASLKADGSLGDSPSPNSTIKVLPDAFARSRAHSRVSTRAQSTGFQDGQKETQSARLVPQLLRRVKQISICLT